MNYPKYPSRERAGKILAQYLEKENNTLFHKVNNNPNFGFSFAIPNGGIPVAEGFCNSLKIQYDIIIVRKIKIPYNPEAGFGSITTDGTILLNQDLIAYLGLTENEINSSINQTKKEIIERRNYYKKSEISEKHYNEIISNKEIFMIDDGLASGFTMLAAIKMVKKYRPNSITIAVPTAPRKTINLIKSEVDNIICPNIRNVLQFAVADAYQIWYDVSNEETLEMLTKSAYYHNI
ncbi:MAG: phosphoribosyltransferase family protein [Candidatus Lokiarchaeota archaeon]